MTEIRVTNEKTGGVKGQKPQRMDLLPWDVLMEDVSPHYAAGAAKYADHNWRKGYDWSLSIGALGRHLAAFASGEDLDEEFETSHMAAVVFHACALLHFMRYHRDLDDRWTPPGGRVADVVERVRAYTEPPHMAAIRHLGDAHDVPATAAEDEAFDDLAKLRAFEDAGLRSIEEQEGPPVEDEVKVEEFPLGTWVVVKSSHSMFEDCCGVVCGHGAIDGDLIRVDLDGVSAPVYFDRRQLERVSPVPVLREGAFVRVLSSALSCTVGLEGDVIGFLPPEEIIRGISVRVDLGEEHGVFRFRPEELEVIS